MVSGVIRVSGIAVIAASIMAVGSIAPVLAQRRSTPADAADSTGRRGQAPLSATAQRIQKRTYVFRETNTKLEYDVFVSTKVDKKKKSPLVIALHGSGVQPGQMLGFISDAAQAGGYIVAAPMGYSLEGWFGVPGRVPPGTTPANLTELSEKDVMNVLDLMRQEFNIDEQRIYLVGQSMGGAGALYLGVKYHQIWAAVAAAAPAAGSLSPSSLENAIDVPMILVQGDADQNVQPAQTRRWADKMRELKMTSEYYEIPGAAHRDAIILGASRIFAFLDKHSKQG
jgi:predicted peptidase